MSSTTGGLNLILLISILLSFLFLIFSIYFFNRRKLKRFVIFDVALILIGTSLILSRILGMINNWIDYSGMGIVLFPLEEGIDGIRVVDAFPWEFIKFNDGNFLIWGIPLGIILGGAFIYIISNKGQDFFEFIDTIVLALLPTKLLLLIGQLISLTYYGKGVGLVNIFIPAAGGQRQNLALMELVAFIGFFVVILIIKLRNNRKGSAFISYLFYEVFAGIVLLSQAEFMNIVGWDLYLSQAVSILILVIILVLFIQSIYLMRRNARMRKGVRSYVTAPDIKIGQSQVSDIELGKKGFFDKLKERFSR